MDDDASTSHNITEDVIRYLIAQEQVQCEDYDISQELALTRVRSILNELISNVQNRGELIEQYQAQLRIHNQYPLFNLADFVPNFQIDENLYQLLTFRETLVISTAEDNTTPLTGTNIVGGLCLDIQTAKGKNPLFRRDPGLEQKLMELFTHKTADGDVDITSEQDITVFEKVIKPLYEHTHCKFLVHLSSHFSADGKSAGSRITAWVDRNLHTLEEKRTEFIDDQEKILYCALQPRRYYVKHASKPDGFLHKKYYSMGKTHHLLCEGANFILMRYLVLTRYMGKFEMSTMYINGDMCRNIYECLPPESGFVNDKKVDICKIYRTIIEECGIIHQCETILMLNGQLVKQKWVDCDYALHINPFADISDKSPPGNEHILLDKVWEKDMELFSTYLDCKNSRAMEIKSYLNDHHEFKNMMADYVQTTLLMKPEEVLDFTIKHFRQYYPQEIDDTTEAELT